jgi:hypothetical protein
MVWGKTSDRAEHQRRSLALTGAYDKRGRSGRELEAAVREGRGSRGGAPIWTMRDVWMPDEDVPLVGRRAKLAAKRRKEGGKWLPTAPYRKALAGGHDRAAERPAYEGPRGIPHIADEQADVDGAAIFGRYPKGWLTHVLKLRLMGDVRRDEILHVCSGTLTERWTVDLRLEARPSIVANGTALPFRDASVKAVMLDPPYTDTYARNLYGTENPRPSWLLNEAARVVMPGGRIGFMHIAIPFAPRRCFLVTVRAITIGVGFRVRAFTIYERHQAELAL